MKIDNAKLEWTASGAPRSVEYGDIYHDAADPLGESRHVFLQANRIAERLGSHEGEFVIAEIGFGAAINFIQTAALWLAAGRRVPLHYLAFELHPLARADLARSIARFPELAVVAERLFAQYPPPVTGCHRLHLFENLQLDLYFGDAVEQLNAHGEGLRGKVHAWYLDGFSPGRNPRMWCDELFEAVAENSRSEATISTYSAAGEVRRGLQRVGFAIERIPGFIGKRHMLRGDFVSDLPAEKATDFSHFPNPWFRLPTEVAASRTAAVIGAGLAGSSTAWHLARKGWQVKVFERAAKLEHGVNTLRQLALRCRIFAQDNPLARFFLAGFLYSVREFQWVSHGEGLEWHDCGLVQLRDGKRRRYDPAVLENLYPDEVLQWRSKEQLRDLTGLPLARAGWCSPAAGWLDPLELCRTWLNHPAIELNPGSGIDEIVWSNDGWRLRSESGELSDRNFPVVVIACGAGALRFAQLEGLPLLAVPGEVPSIRETANSSAIRHIVQGERSIFPAHQGRHCISANFGTEKDSRKNTVVDSLATVRQLFDPPSHLHAESVGNMTAERCQSTDFAPILGAAPDFPACGKLYAQLARNARATGLPPPAHHPGLFLNLAHGSHGLCSAPLAAEYLASLIQDQAPPLSREIATALDPLRFLIRDLKRQQAFGFRATDSRNAPIAP